MSGGTVWADGFWADGFWADGFWSGDTVGIPASGQRHTNNVVLQHEDENFWHKDDEMRHERDSLEHKT